MTERARRRVRRGAAIGVGTVLVCLPIVWLVIRNGPALRSAFGMDTVLGWGAHAVALLILLAGVALLARGIFGSPDLDASGDD